MRRTILHGPCREFGCIRRPAYVESGYCLWHNSRRHIYGSMPLAQWRLNWLFYHGPCREPPCDRRVRGPHGYCRLHHEARVIRGQAPRTPSALTGPKCRLPSCARAYAKKQGGGYGLCGAHYRRLNRLYQDADQRRWAAGMGEVELEALLGHTGAV